MKTSNNINATTFSAKFSILIVLLAFFSLQIGQTAIASGPNENITLSQKTGGALVINLGETMSGFQVISVENLVIGQSGSTRGGWIANPNESMDAIIFNHSAPGNLPANSEVAILTVTDPVYGFTKSYLLGTDGGAVLLVLADL